MTQKTKKVVGKLPQSLIRQFGETSDIKLAEDYGLPVVRVRFERARRGIAAYTSYQKWDKNKIALLGTKSDENIARRLSVSPSTVARQRRIHGIPPYGQSREQQRHRWTKRQITLLGKFPDSVIAKRFGVSPYTVSWKRRQLGIVANIKGGKPGIKWTKQHLRLLGKMPDTVVARRLNRHRHQVSLKRIELGIENFITRRNDKLWTPKVIARIGKETDMAIATDLGIDTNRVTAYRRRHGIANCSSKTKRLGKRNSEWSASIVARLGKAPDQAIAIEMGITRQAVARYRSRLGIEPFYKR